ncbi:MAG: MFS transporter [Thermoproteota archaeon]
MKKTGSMLTLFLLSGAVWASMAPLLLFFGVYLMSLGFSYSDIGLISTFGIVSSSIPQLIFGAVADKIIRRKPIIVFAVSIRVLAGLMMLVSKDVVSISAWYILASFSLAGFMPIAQSMVADMAEGEEVGRLMGNYRLFGSAGWAVSCVLTGLLVTEKLENIFSIFFFFSIASFPLALLLKESWRPPEKEGGEAGTVMVKSSIALTLCFTASIILSSLSMGATNVFITIFLSKLGMEPLLIGVTIALGALMEIPAMYLGGMLCDRVGSLTVLSAGEVGLAFIYWLYGTVGNIYTYVIVQSIRGILYAVFTVAGMTASSSLWGEEKRGFYASLYNLSLNMGMSLGPSFGGFISDKLGLLATFLISSLISLISATILSPWTVLKKRSISR